MKLSDFQPLREAIPSALAFLLNQYQDYFLTGFRPIDASVLLEQHQTNDSCVYVLPDGLNEGYSWLQLRFHSPNLTLARLNLQLLNRIETGIFPSRWWCLSVSWLLKGGI